MVKRKLTPTEAINEALAAINNGRIEKAKKIHTALVSLNSPALTAEIQQLTTRLAKHKETFSAKADSRQPAPTLEAFELLRRISLTSQLKCAKTCYYKTIN